MIEPDAYQAPATKGPGGHLPVEMAIVSPRYFETIGTPIVRGREFSEADDQNAPPVVIVNEQMAERYWPHQEAVGKWVTLSGPHDSRMRAEIIGVAKTGRYSSLGEDPKAYFYRPLLQNYQPGVQLVVRTHGDLPVLAALRQEVRGLDSRLALTGSETLEQHMQLPLFPARAAGAVLGIFGVLALGLAVVGIYGVMSYAVSQRIGEIGVRMALGATPRDVLRLVVWQGMRLTLAGLGLGLAIAAAGTRVLSHVLYGIKSTDPLSYAAVIVVLALAAMLASYVPARWATRLDPIRALRVQ
jgi:predicted permease